MLKDNRIYNTQVTSNTAFLKTLRDKLPEFFTADKFDEDGVVISQGTFDFEKFRKALAENSIQTELTSGYQLNFIGKDYAKKQAGEAPTTVVLPDKVHNEQIENQNSQNLFFTGDNLEVLRHLQAGYENSIDVIYIDPPYNTGSDGFVYPDKFEYSDDKLQAMFGMSDEELKRLKSIQGKATHSAWLTFMYPRLWLANRLLKETGVIFVSIDDNEQANLKMLMDEIFGEGQFRNALAVRRFDKNLNRQFMDEGLHSLNVGLETIFVYAKNTDMKFQPVFRESSEERGQFGYWKGFWNNADRPTMRYDILGYTPETGQWKWKQEIALEAIENYKEYQEKYADSMTLEEYYIKTGKTKKFLRRNLSGNGKNKGVESWIAPTDRILRTSNWSDLLVSKKPSYHIPFDSPKNPEVIKELINFSGADNSALILDFFAGSATTADAVMQLNAEDGGNRQFIMVQLPELTFTQNSDGTKVARKGSESAFKAGYQSIDEISRERIKRASQKIQEEKGLELPEEFDGGFKHYRVLEPSQATLDDLDSFDIETGKFIDNKGNHLLLSESGFDDMISPFSSEGLGFDNGATGEETILSTWLLADGYSILTPVKELNLAGYQANYVNSERLYLIAEGWSSEQTKELVNIIGNNEKVVQTIVLYGYSFGMESMRELESALEQLDTKVNLIKRY